MKQWDVIYQFDRYYVVPPTPVAPAWKKMLGMALFAIGLGGLLGPMIPTLRMESELMAIKLRTINYEPITQSLPPAAPVVFEPLLDPAGSIITPASEDFSIVIPKIGVNAPVTANVSLTDYRDTLKTSVAHASTSFLPDENGTVYLFSHSTNYDWFVDDLNAVFYLLKNLEHDDTIVVVYKGKRYTYKITDKRVVSPKSTSYLYPFVGSKNLILQTCWPPGSTTQRLLIFANLIKEESYNI